MAMATVAASSSSSTTTHVLHHFLRPPLQPPYFPSSFLRPLSTATVAAKPTILNHENTHHLQRSIDKRATLFSPFSPLLSYQPLATPPPFSFPLKALSHSLSSPQEIGDDDDDDFDEKEGEFENEYEEVDLELEEFEEEEEEDEDGEEEKSGEEAGVGVSRRAVKEGLEVPNLSITEKKELASYAHSLGKKLKSQSVGKSGVTDNLATSFLETLERNELLKIRIHNNCPGELDDVVQRLEQATGSVVVFKIGRTVIIYRPSLTRMQAEEKKRQNRRILERKGQKPKTPSLPRGRQSRFSPGRQRSSKVRA